MDALLRPLRGRSVELAYKTCVVVAVAAGAWWTWLMIVTGCFEACHDPRDEWSLTRAGYLGLGVALMVAVAAAAVWLGRRIEGEDGGVAVWAAAYAVCLSVGGLLLSMLLLPLLWLPASWWLAWKAFVASRHVR